MEDYSRRNNLLIDGIEESPPGVAESQDRCLDKVLSIFEESLELQNTI